MNVDVRHLRAFLAVADEQSFTRAAERLHITQPSLSVIIRDLEGALDLKLFDRTTRAVSLTMAGRYLMTDARRLVRELERSLSDLRSITDLERGSLKLAVLPSIATSIVPAALAEFSRHYPAIDIQVEDCRADSVLDAVDSADADLGITVLTPQLAADYDWTLLARDTLVAILPAEHPLNCKPRLTWRELEGEPLIAMRAGSSVAHLIEESGVASTFDLRFSLQVSYMSSAVAMTQVGLGITILPSLGVNALLTSGTRLKPIVEPSVRREIALIQRRDRWIPPAAEVFKQILKEISPAFSD